MSNYSDELDYSLRRAYRGRLKQAYASAKELTDYLEKIKDGRISIDSMSAVRGLISAVSQQAHEASAYHSAWMSYKKISSYKADKPKYKRRYNVAAQPESEVA